MAETLSFSSGNFNLGENDAKGTVKLAVDDQGDGRFLLTNDDGSTIKGLGIQGDNEPLTLEIVSDATTTLKRGTINLGNEGDTLIISGKTKKDSDFDTGKGKDRFASGDTFNASDLEMGKGRDRARLNNEEGKFVAKESSFSMGAGNDKLVFNGGVKEIQADLGTGEDTLIFGGDIKGATVNLGADGQKDTIKIAEGAKIEGLKIEGAEVGDVLFIGSTEYQYNAVNNSWVNGDEEIKF